MAHTLKQLMILLTLSIISSHALSYSSAHVNRKQLSLNQELILTITTDQSKKIPNSALNEIEKNFHIRNQYSNYQFSIVNGDITKRYEIALYLQAKNTGTFVIPSIKLGQDATQAIEIEITQSSTTNNNISNSNDSTSAFAETVLLKESSYVQEQNILLMRIYSPHSILESKIKPPAIANAELKFLERLSYNKNINNIDYHVHEYRFALFALQSGELNIPGSFIKAEINNYQASNRTQFFNFSFGQTIDVDTPQAFLKVKPIPSQHSLNWLPANTVSITQAWSHDINQLSIGDTLSRQIEIEVHGALPEHLPKFTYDEVENLKIYPDASQSNIEETPHGVITRVQQNISLIPTLAGNYILPEISLQWWDNTQKIMRKSSIPATTIKVLAENGQTSGNTFGKKTVKSAQNSTLASTAKTESITTDTSNQQANTSIFTWIIWGAIGLFLLFISYYIINKRSKFTLSNNDSNDLKIAFKAFEKACLENNLAEIENTLLSWSKLQWPQQKIISIRDIEQLISEQHQINYKNEITLLQQQRYSSSATHTQWNAKKLLTIISTVHHNKAQNKKNNDSNKLPKLYG